MLEKERFYKFDNIRFILIFCVVFGHFLELFLDDPIALGLYKIIYSFHMPVFVFLTGYFAKFKFKRILLQFVFPYFIFQTLYLIFDYYVVGKSDVFTLQYTTPYWILWYLFATIIYYCIIPVLDFAKKKARGLDWLLMVLAAVWSLLSGFNEDFGYYLSLGRIWTFLPFFVIGWYAGNTDLFKTLVGFIEKHKKLFLMISFFGVVFSVVFILFVFQIPYKALYGSLSYKKAGYTIWMKFLFCVISLIFGLFLFLAVPTKKICGVSMVGKHTYYIFLIHGFFVRFIQTTELFTMVPYGKFSLALLFSLLVVVLLGNSAVYKVCNFIFAGKWIDGVWKRIKNKGNK